jgi:predicted PhzF superfamily epimerase YddE/YHI9
VRLPIFHLDAFATGPFSGNPAAVVPLERWLDDATMLAIASENALGATAFLVREEGAWGIRWFTPAVEVDLCGHATLAAGHVVLTRLDPGKTEVRFDSRSGMLAVHAQADGLLELDFPARPGVPCSPPIELVQALGRAPRACFKGRDYLAVFESEERVRTVAPDLAEVARLDAQGVIVTAPGTDCDFVSRYFAPAAGIDEDPVTGSAHCALVPYWSDRLGKTKLHARQLSRRGGELTCEQRGARVGIAGRVVPYLEGAIELP